MSPGDRFWPSWGAPGQPGGPLQIPGGSIERPWGTILATQGSTGTAQRTPVGLDVDFDGFWFAFWSIVGGVWDCINSVIVWELLQKPRFQQREILMPKLSILVVWGNMPEAWVTERRASRAKES